MIAMNKFGFKALLATAFLAAAFGSQAAEVAGIKFDETTKVAGKELKLNGLGIRTKVIFKLYAAGLYLPEKKTTTAEILKLEGPRRMELVMMREISSEDLGKAFMNGLNENADTAEKTRLIAQISKFGEMFAMLESLKKGDILHLDWTGSVTQCELNGKKIGEAVPDIAFYNAVLRIWLGDKPADRSLKPALLGEAK
jgi:hypothetical protein